MTDGDLEGRKEKGCLECEIASVIYLHDISLHFPFSCTCMSRDSCFMQTQAVMAPLKVGGRALNSNGVLHG